MPNSIAVRSGLACLAAAVLAPGAAFAESLTPALVFENAALPVKAIVVGLVAATLAAGVTCALKLSSGPRLAGGSAFLSGLRLGGPLAGFVGAAYGGFLMALFSANSAVPAPPSVMAQGVAEAMMLILLGLASGAVAVVAHWAVEARIDRAVLAD
jgi:hypothetical protein